LKKGRKIHASVWKKTPNNANA